LAIREMKRVLVPSGRVGLNVYTLAASAFASALDHRLGSDASRINRGEHIIFPLADEVGALVTREGFERVNVSTVTKRITFPSVVDYVLFQLVATPMACLLLRDGRLSFAQEAHLAIAHKTR
jgi:hypothetical protein